MRRRRKDEDDDRIRRWLVNGLFGLVIIVITVFSSRTSVDTRRPMDVSLLGIGTAGLHNDDVCTAIGAVGSGLIDTAAQDAVWYQNEKAVGRCVQGNREKWTIQTKLHPKDHGTRNAVAALKRSLENLKTAYIDVFLFHYPKCRGDVCPKGAVVEGTWKESWRGLVPFVRNGTIRHLGVSNMHDQEFGEALALARETGVRLSVDQEFCDVLHKAVARRRVCAANGVLFQAYSPLGGQRWLQKPNPVLSHPVLRRIADAHGATPAQVALAWHRQSGMSAVPKSSRPERVKENMASLAITLRNEEMAEIDGLEEV